MRKSVRKLMGVAVIGLVGALFASPMLAAGAQEAPTPPGDCIILSAVPNPVDAFPATVTVSGTAPTGVHIVLYVNGLPASEQDVTDNTFSLSANLTAASDLSVNYTYGDGNAYTAACATPGGEVVIRVNVKGSEIVRPAASLAFTGSSNTPSYVLIGIAALVLGAVLMVAARRRSQLS